MNEQPRQKLCELIARHGTVLCDEPGRCEGYLRDFCAPHRGEVNVLINALKERVAVDLLSASVAVPIELVLGRLSKRLEEHLGMKEQTARWAVESWALALGKVSEKEIRPAPAESSATQSAPALATPARPAVAAKAVPATAPAVPAERLPLIRLVSAVLAWTRAPSISGQRPLLFRLLSAMVAWFRRP